MPDEVKDYYKKMNNNDKLSIETQKQTDIANNKLQNQLLKDVLNAKSYKTFDLSDFCMSGLLNFFNQNSIHSNYFKRFYSFLSLLF